MKKFIIIYIMLLNGVLNLNAFDNSSNQNIKKTTPNTTKEKKEYQTADLPNSNIEDYNTIIKGNDLENNSGSNNMKLNQNQSHYYNVGFNEGFELGKKMAEEEITQRLLSMENYLDRIFNFQRLYIEGKILPPEVSVIRTPKEVTDNGKTMIIEQEVIKIVEPAKLVEDSKTWHNYLIER